MRIDLEDAEVAVFFAHCPVESEGGAMVAAEEAHQFAFVEEGFTYGNAIRLINVEDLDRRAADCCSAEKDRSVPGKVCGPFVAARVKQADDLSRLGIYSRKIT